MTMTLEERQTRAAIRALFQGVRVFALESCYRYCSPSMSVEGIAYEITVYEATDNITCNCPAGQHGKPCKHAEAVKSRLPLDIEAQQAEEIRRGRDMLREVADGLGRTDF